MKKLALFAVSVLGLTVVTQPVSTFANEKSDTKVESEETLPEVSVQSKGFFDELIETNSFVDETVADLTDQGFDVSYEIISVEESDFIYYEKTTDSIYGLVQVSEEGNTSLELTMKDDTTVESAVFTNEDGEEIYLDVTEDGESVDVYTDEGTVSTFALTPDQKSTLCSILVGVAGGGVGAIYQAVAAALGGPIAAGVVWAINTLGWSYVSSKC